MFRALHRKLRSENKHDQLFKNKFANKNYRLIRHIGVAVVDNDLSSASRRLVQKISVSDYFTLHQAEQQYASALEALEDGKVDAFGVFGATCVSGLKLLGAYDPAGCYGRP